MLTSCELPGVDVKVPPLVAAGAREHGTMVQVGDVAIGGEQLVVIAGPCAVEHEQQMMDSAEAVRSCGAQILRGGAYKPRTSPYSFQGLEEEGLHLLRQTGSRFHMPVVTEVVDTRLVGRVSEYADMLQVGSRNMSNFALLQEVGHAGKPVLLKRGMHATIEEWLHAAEYVLKTGNDRVVLCERGIRTFENAYRNTLDLNAVAMLKRLTHLPVLVDPSHGTGHRWMVGTMASAAIAAGADGVMVEVHHAPEKARCDGKQSLTPDDFRAMMLQLEKLAPAVQRTMPGCPEDVYV